ncbi:hypothetical protein Ocin01_08089 [Orchesella cincta]|uniref:Uncharacterized protein n=1 Tax=Orchesella cincta TaxID=48709 RepID=A0A1D2N011_ORCCI|nr:hypothetical protein Ocin01_08089 [Orchesella cincta]
MKFGKFILIVGLSISSLAILVSGKPSSRRLKNQRNKETEVDITKNDDSGSATSAIPPIGSLISSNVSAASVQDSDLTLPTPGLKPKKLKKSHRLKHRRFGHHHKKHNRRSHNHRGIPFRRRHHNNSTKQDDPTESVTTLDASSSILNSEPADLPSLKLLRSGRSGHRKFKRHHHHHHHRPQSKRLGKKAAKEQLAGENKEE